MAEDAQTFQPVSNQATGRWGEELVLARYLENGYRLVVRNWQVRQGEIDLILQNRDTLVFVEVKTRSAVKYGEPIESIDWRKQIRLARLAEFYLALNPPERRIRSVRLDAAEVFDTEMPPRIRITENILEL
jgi:putative endonuclease